MEHNTIVLSATEYKRLVIFEERCAIIEGILRKAGFITDTELRVILGIEETEGENG